MSLSDLFESLPDTFTKGKVGEAFTASGQGGSAIRIAEGALASVGAAALINHFVNNPGAKSTHNGAKLHYAIVDMHSDTVIKPLSTQRVYKILTHRSRRRVSGTKKVTFIQAPAGELTRVK